MDIVIYIAVHEDKFYRTSEILYYYLNKNQDSTLHRLNLKKEEMQFNQQIAHSYKVFWLLQNKPDLLDYVKEIENKFKKI